MGASTAVAAGDKNEDIDDHDDDDNCTDGEVDVNEVKTMCTCSLGPTLSMTFFITLPLPDKDPHLRSIKIYL